MTVVPYGWFTTEISSKRPKNIVCYNCGSKGEMFVRRFARAFSLFFIPVFPFRIYSEVSCVRCKASLKYSDMDSDLKAKYIEFKSSKIPVWLFSGVIAVIGLVIWSLFSDLKERDEFMKRLENAPAGRVIDFQTDNDKYSALKICAVEDSTYLVIYNSYEVELYGQLEKILSEGYFSKDTIEMSLNSIKTLIDDGKVKAVHW